MTCRIERTEANGGVLYVLSGTLDREHAVELDGLLAGDRGRSVTLDLIDITLLAPEAMRLLARAQEEGVVLVNCPDYVSTWLAADRSSR